MKQVYLIIIASFLLSNCSLNAQTIWAGPDFTFTKTANVDWTLPINQDSLTEEIILTRQNSKMIYNYKYFQSNFGSDVDGEGLSYNFWNNTNIGIPILTFPATGGPKGLKWALLDDSGSSTDWSSFTLYGTLGDPSNFYSFHNIISIIASLEDNTSVASIDDDFNINGNTSGTGSDVGDVYDIVGKKLAVWIEADDIYFTITFNTWGSGGSGGEISYARSTIQPLNTEKINLGNNIKLTPNHSSDFVLISGLEESIKYSVFNILGAEIQKGNISNNEKIDIQNLTNGLYFFKLDNGKAIKFVKE